MQNVVARLSKTPGAIRHAGRPFGADTEAVLAGLGRPVAVGEPRERPAEAD
jgi:hypothetical protein